MSQDWSEELDSIGRDGSVAGGQPERFYMNKSYGRSLERARALDERPGGQQDGGELQRATIEPDSSGGHKVIVERSATAIRGGGAEQGNQRSEHSFAKPEDALRFLEDILHGRLPGEGEAGNGDAGSGDAGNGQPHRSAAEDLLGDVLSGTGGRG
jgi:hypothetical protein